MEKRICLNQSVLDFAESKLSAEKSIMLELGSGYSTAWFAKKCFELITFETEYKWVKEIKKDLNAKQITNVQMVEAFPTTTRFGSAIINMVMDPVDLILVDCREDLRFAGLISSWQVLKDGCWLLFDDAQRPRHKESLDWLNEQSPSPPVPLTWAEGDIETAKSRLCLAYKK